MSDHPPCNPACAACAACAEEQQLGESREAWLSRLGEIVRASGADACANGHPWTAETTRYSVQGWLICRACARESSTRSHSKQRSKVAA